MDFGVYVHVPFCRIQCPYCTFYTVPKPRAVAPMQRFAAALGVEWNLRVRPRLQRGDRMHTLYWGGGTPSDLPADSLVALLERWSDDVPGGLAGLDEVTVECNPETALPATLDGWRDTGVNRVSLGVQSLDDRDLRVLGRGADAACNRAAIAAVSARFATWNADLIVGVPGSEPQRFEASLATLAGAGAPHLSFYCLELPPGRARAFGDPQTEESEAAKADLYAWASEWVEQHGYRHYEISNAALPGHEARHNRSYWDGVEYVGLGPGAHSYAGDTRRANRADWQAYMAALEAGLEPPSASETLDATMRHRERLLVGLRLRDGLELASAGLDPGAPILGQLAEAGLLRLEAGRIRLTTRGWLVSDSIVLQLLAA